MTMIRSVLVSIGAWTLTGNAAADCSVLHTDSQTASKTTFSGCVPLNRAK